MNKFLFDRDSRGQPLELAIADHLQYKNIPFGFNAYSGTDDPRREDFDLYVGHPEDNPLLLEVKMDWLTGFTGNLFVEKKTLDNTRAHKLIYGLLYLHSFDTEELRRMYEERLTAPTWDGRQYQVYKYKHLIGGDQANNEGMILPRSITKTAGQPFWQVVRELTQRQ